MKRSRGTGHRDAGVLTLIVAFVGAPISMYAPAAAAADAGTEPPGQGEEGDQLGEIVVTAQKREQSIQDVPISISAFSADQLRQSGVTNLDQVTALAPNVNLEAGQHFGGSGSALSASIRGIGQDDFAFNLDPGVGVYLDGVYLARSVGANQGLLDVARIEILKGPQGTLFGRNTIGGAVSIITRTPGDEFSITGQATGGRFSRTDAALMVDIPFSPKLLSTFTVSTASRDGWQKRIPFTSATAYVVDSATAFKHDGYEAFDTQGGQDEQVARAKFLWTPSDNFTATWATDWTHHNQPAMAQDTILSNSASAPNFLFPLYNACISLPAAVINGAGLALVCGPRGTAPYVAPPLLDANGNGVNFISGGGDDRLVYDQAAFETGDIDTTYASGPNFDRLTSWGTALTLEWRLSEGVALKTITGFRKLDWTVGLDQDQSPGAFVELSFGQHQKQISEEVQLLGNAVNDRLHYVGGLFYFEEKGNDTGYVTFPAGLFQIDGPIDLKTTSYAAFMHLDFDITDRFGVSLGGRYSSDEKELESFQTDRNSFVYKISTCYPSTDPANIHLSPLIPPGVTCREALGFPDPSNPDRYFPPGVQSLDFDVFNPSGGVQYHFTDDLMGYLSYSEGFKTGGWFTRLQSPYSVAPIFRPEEATTYEAGVKSQWFDNHLIVNVAGFYTEYKDVQLQFFDGLSPVIRNAGDAEIRGGELEAQAILGGGFSINANVGYMDAKYVSLDPGAVAVGLLLTNKLPKTPDLKYSVSPQFESKLANGGSLRFLVDYAHTGKLFNDAVNTPYLARPATDVLGASIAYSSPGGHNTLTVGGSNLTDERYLTTGSDGNTIQNASGTYNPPSQWYLTFRFEY